MMDARQPQPKDDELKAFLIVLNRALKMITGYIDRRYEIGEGKGKRAA